MVVMIVHRVDMGMGIGGDREVYIERAVGVVYDVSATSGRSRDEYKKKGNEG